MVDMRVGLAGVTLQNPILPASGTFGFGEAFAAYYDLNVLGGLVLKGTTLAPRFGNPTPRIAECASGMLNAVGLQNPGAADVIEKELPRLRTQYHGPVVANVSGFSVEEYAACCALLDAHVDLLEVNISCPNVRHGGMSFGTSAKSAAEVTRAVKAVSRKPVFMKLSPNVTDIVEIARACEEAGADGLSLINTLLGMRIDLRTRKPVLANTMGGLSGPAIFPVALRMIYQVTRAVRIPVMGMGGVATAHDAAEMLLAGATAVQVGAENLRNPYACAQIIAELPAQLEALGVQSVREWIGGVKE